MILIFSLRLGTLNLSALAPVLSAPAFSPVTESSRLGLYCGL